MEVALIVALVVTNALWFVFHVITHAQHMRAYQWMIGFRPVGGNNNAVISPRVASPAVNLPLSADKNAPLVSPDALIGQVSP